MTTTRITTIAGLVAAVAGALLGVEGVISIPYAKTVLTALSAVSVAILGYFAKGRRESGSV